MKIENSIAIFRQIDCDEYTEDEKAIAIHYVLKMPTHNSITKGDILKVT